MAVVEKVARSDYRVNGHRVHKQGEVWIARGRQGAHGRSRQLRFNTLGEAKRFFDTTDEEGTQAMTDTTGTVTEEEQEQEQEQSQEKSKRGRGRPRSQETIERDETIFAFIKETPRTKKELTELTGYSDGIVYLSLHRLRQAGQAEKRSSGSRAPVWVVPGDE